MFLKKHSYPFLKARGESWCLNVTTMTEFLKKRKAIKMGREWLQHARLCRNMRGDIAPAAAIEALLDTEQRLSDALNKRDMVLVDRECAAIRDAAQVVMPFRAMAGLRENLEVIVVALAVAMAFRCYFLQPFKIPTGSMQPSLYGIHYASQTAPGAFDQHPLRILKWLVFGEWYMEIKADAAGRVRGPIAEGGGMLIYDIGGLIHRVPHEMVIAIKSGDEVVTGQIIARGLRITGDHLFVNRVRWNFTRPTRGEVMVFRTKGIAPYPGLANDTHYIKRMCGLPGESISIKTPKLVVNGSDVLLPKSIRQIETEAPGYVGYHPARVTEKAYIPTEDTVVNLGSHQYLALGDNTQSSLDSRYWGPVPEANLVGPACIVYWPLSRRTGFVR